MEHRGDERIGDSVPGDIEHGDAGLFLAAFEVLDDVEPPLFEAALD